MADENGETRRQRNARFGIAESPELELPASASHVWGWFWELSSRRHSGPEALTFADIGQWVSLLQIELLPEEVQMLVAMDDQYLRAVREDQTREQQQQARRLAEAGTKELERVKAALEPIRPPAAAKPRARDPQKARVRAALQQMRRGV